MGKEARVHETPDMRSPISFGKAGAFRFWVPHKCQVQGSELSSDQPFQDVVVHNLTSFILAPQPPNCFHQQSSSASLRSTRNGVR